MKDQPQESLVEESRDPLLRVLNKVVVFCVRILAILMVLLIFWALIDVIMHMYSQVVSTVASRFNIEDLFSTLGAFLAVLIAIEIFLNIVFYLKKDAIHVPLVLSTALTAVARKVILLDYNTLSADKIFATAAVIFAVGVSYWLITRKSE